MAAYIYLYHRRMCAIMSFKGFVQNQPVLLCCYAFACKESNADALSSNAEWFCYRWLAKLWLTVGWCVAQNPLHQKAGWTDCMLLNRYCSYSAKYKMNQHWEYIISLSGKKERKKPELGIHQLTGKRDLPHIHAWLYVEYALKMLTPVQSHKLGSNGSKLGKNLIKHRGTINTLFSVM